MTARVTVAGAAPYDVVIGSGLLEELPAMLAGLHLPVRQMAVGSSLVVHVDGDGHVVSHEWHDPRS